MMGWAFRHLNLHRIELSVEPDNEAAIRVYEQAGFTLEGRRREHHYDDGCYKDEQILGILRREFEAQERARTEGRYRSHTQTREGMPLRQR